MANEAQQDTAKKEEDNTNARPYRVLFACPQTLFDVSNGASIQCYSMMQELSRRGIKCASIGGGIFDNPSGVARIPNFAQQLEENKGRTVLVNEDSSANPDNPITHYFFTGFHSTVWNDMTLSETNSFLNEYSRLLRVFKPDLVLGYGCDSLCRSMWVEAKLLGIPTGYMLCNGNHHFYRFPLHDVVLTDSQATADVYKETEGLTCHPYGIFIDPNHVIAQNRIPQCVTFINPAFAKGAAVVARIILMVNKIRPDITFQVVETRLGFVDAMKSLRAPGGEPGSAFNNQTFKNIALRPASYEVSQIYQNTGLLLAPSLWYESWGRVATEATMNGIPVLASKSGGLPEAVGDGGICLDTPASCSDIKNPDKWLTLPSEEECQPWVDALIEMWDKKDEWYSKCIEASQKNSPKVSGDRLMAVIEPLLARKAGDQDFCRIGSIRYEDDPLDWEGQTKKMGLTDY